VNKKLKMFLLKLQSPIKGISSRISQNNCKNINYLKVINSYMNNQNKKSFWNWIFLRFTMKKLMNRKKNVVNQQLKNCKKKFRKTRWIYGNFQLTGINYQKVLYFNEVLDLGCKKWVTNTWVGLKRNLLLWSKKNY
jgi:hypothetical protein